VHAYVTEQMFAETESLWTGAIVCRVHVCILDSVSSHKTTHNFICSVTMAIPCPGYICIWLQHIKIIIHYWIIYVE